MGGKCLRGIEDLIVDLVVCELGIILIAQCMPRLYIMFEKQSTQICNSISLLSMLPPSHLFSVSTIPLKPAFELINVHKLGRRGVLNMTLNVFVHNLTQPWFIHVQHLVDAVPR